MSSTVTPHIAATLPLSAPSGKTIVGATIFAVAAGALWTLPDTLSVEGRKVLIVTLGAVFGWVATRLPDSLVAIGAAVALVLWRAIPEAQFFATLGSDLVWLLLAAFLIAAILKDSGLIETVTEPLIGHAPRVITLFAILTIAIAATAFVLPSTSARAALLLPVFTALVPALPDHRIVRALALLFPSVILLSAGGSLIGAGAHLVAVEAISGSTGLRLGYFDWLLLGAPMALLASSAAAILILWMFVPSRFLRARLLPLPTPQTPSPRQWQIVTILAVIVALWTTEPLHGLSITVVAILGALVLLLPTFSARKPKEVFRSIDTELLVYLAATMLIARAMMTSGADRWLADGALAILPSEVAAHSVGIAIALSIFAVATHLVVTSRSARAAVLIPAVALPAAGLGHDAALTVLIVTMGTGFCQTMMASAKPVAIYGNQDDAGFTQHDLLKLALPLAPLKVLLLTGFAIWIWPSQIDTMRDVNPMTDATETVTQTRFVAPVIPNPTSERDATSPVAFTFSSISELAPLSSPQPQARPDRFSPVAFEAAPQQLRTGMAPRTGSQVSRDLIAAQRQIEADLRQAGQHIMRGLGRLF